MEERALLADLNRNVNLRVCNNYACGNLGEMSLSQYGSLKMVPGNDIPFKYGFSTVIDFFANTFTQDEVLLNSAVDEIAWAGDGPTRITLQNGNVS